MCPIAPNVIWALDFQFDQTSDRRILKLLNVIDEYSRECLAIVVGRSIDADSASAACRPWPCNAAHGDTCSLTTGASSSPTWSRTGAGSTALTWSSSILDCPGRTPGSSRSTAGCATVLERPAAQDPFEAQVLIEDWRTVITTWRRAHRAHRGMTHAEFAPRLLPGRLARPPCLARRALGREPPVERPDQAQLKRSIDRRSTARFSVESDTRPQVAVRCHGCAQSVVRVTADREPCRSNDLSGPKAAVIRPKGSVVRDEPADQRHWLARPITDVSVSRREGPRSRLSTDRPTTEPCASCLRARWNRARGGYQPTYCLFPRTASSGVTRRSCRPSRSHSWSTADCH